MTAAHPIRTAALASISLVLALNVTGCAGTRETLLPQDGKPMIAIYREHFQRMRTETEAGGARERLPLRPLTPEEVALDGYTREAENEIRTVFPRLPNPTLVMYVFPHLAAEEGHPVPGYATSFPMYERAEYALPGEVPMRAAAVAR